MKGDIRIRLLLIIKIWKNDTSFFKYMNVCIKSYTPRSDYREQTEHGRIQKNPSGGGGARGSLHVFSHQRISQIAVRIGSVPEFLRRPINHHFFPVQKLKRNKVNSESPVFARLIF